MDDAALIALFWARDPMAIDQTEKKYSGYCLTIANRILLNWEDTEECVNDAWYRIWNTIPPQRPVYLSAFLAKVTRNLAIDRIRQQGAAKRGNSQITLALDELASCVGSSANGPENVVAAKALVAAVNEEHRFTSCPWPDR